MKTILIFGEDEFLVERSVRSETESLLPDLVFKYKFPEDLNNYINESQSSPIEDLKRIFVVFGAKGQFDLPVRDSDNLIVVCDSYVKWFDFNKIIEVPAVKFTPDGKEVIRWIEKEGESLTINLNKVSTALFLNSGNCLRKLSSEIEKISLVVSKNSIVKPDDIRGLLCFSNSEISPRSIVESICNGQTSRALAYYDKLQERADETGWIIAHLLRMILQQIKLENITSDFSDIEAAKALDCHPFYYKRQLSQRKGTWSKDTLLCSFRKLCSLDLLNKRGLPLVENSLIIEIISLSEGALKNVIR